VSKPPKDRGSTVPHNHTETSKGAARRVRKTLPLREQEVYDVFCRHHFGLTTEEAEQQLGWSHQSTSARINGLWNKGRLIKTEEKRTNKSGSEAFVYVADIYTKKESRTMAKKKTEKAEPKDPREWHKKAATVFLDQAGEGEGLTGFTFSEIRKVMGLNQGDAGFAEVAAAMTDLRNEGFLAHKFSHSSLKEDFYEGDPTEIPNIQKRENEAKIRQLVFFVHPAMMGLGEAAMAAVEAGEFPEDFEYENSATVLDRETIFNWFDGLGEIIDVYVEDDEQKMLAAKMIAALMPEKE
jgi:hypothetical protein